MNELGDKRLSGLTVGLSLSESEDLGRLGFAETHMRLMLGELARGLLISGASILYGGRIDPEGYTDFLRNEIERYGRHDGRLIVCLPWSVHRAMTLAEIEEARGDFGLYGDLLSLGPEGTPIAFDSGRGQAPEPVGPEETAASLSAARQTMTGMAHVRVLAGGKRHGYQGAIPGVLEEALLSLAAGKALYLAGGFGGVTGDLARGLGLDPAEALPDLADEAVPGMDRLDEAAEAGRWTSEQNGLDEAENRRLAVSHRPGEVTSLVLGGLRSLASARSDRLAMEDG